MIRILIHPHWIRGKRVRPCFFIFTKATILIINNISIIITSNKRREALKFLRWLLLSERPTMERLCAQIWTWVIIFWGWILNSYWWMIFTCWMRSPWKVGSGVGGSVHASQVDSLPRLVSVGNWKRLNSEKFWTIRKRLTIASTSMSMLSSPIQSFMNHQGHHRCFITSAVIPSWTITIVIIVIPEHFHKLSSAFSLKKSSPPSSSPSWTLAQK